MIKINGTPPGWRLVPWPRKFCITARRYGNNAAQPAALSAREHDRSGEPVSPSSYRAVPGLIASLWLAVSCNCLLASVCVTPRRCVMLV